MINQQQFYELFVARTSCLLFDLSEKDNQCGWVGGNAPAYFDDKENIVNDSELKYYFYMTLVSPIDNCMISVFIPAFEEYLERNIYPDCGIKVFKHEISPVSQYNYYEMFTEKPTVMKTRYQKNFDYSNPTIRRVFLSNPRFVSKLNEEEEMYFLQLGGQPLFIQNECFYYDSVMNDGYQFFFSVDEQGYLENMIHGNYPFSYGAVYYYAKMSDNNISDVIAGFWQYS